jgi:hypothetical protein
MAAMEVSSTSAWHQETSPVAARGRIAGYVYMSAARPKPLSNSNVASVGAHILLDRNSNSATSNIKTERRTPMPIQAESKINPLLSKAIEETRLVRLFYKDRDRIVEPHDYGIHNGIVKLFGYQVGGSSSQKLPNWRWMEQDLISDIQLLSRTFPGGRLTSSGKHHEWDKLFIRVKPSDKKEK